MKRQQVKSTYNMYDISRCVPCIVSQRPYQCAAMEYAVDAYQHLMCRDFSQDLTGHIRLCHPVNRKHSKSFIENVRKMHFSTNSQISVSCWSNTGRRYNICRYRGDHIRYSKHTGKCFRHVYACRFIGQLHENFTSKQENQMSLGVWEYEMNTSQLRH